MLVPLIKLIHDPVTLYRAALVLNAVFVTLTYLMFVYILRFLFPKGMRYFENEEKKAESISR